MICVDEVLLNRREDSERIKNLSTARSYKAEAKGRDRREVEFFGKFVLCSNNERNPVLIEAAETRYWVRACRRFRMTTNTCWSKCRPRYRGCSST